MADEARSYEPTPRRLRLARERGEVAQSPLFSGAVVLTAVCGVVATGGAAFVDAWLEAVRVAWSDPAAASPEAFAALGARALAWPLGVAVLAATLASLAQVGPLWAPRALRFDLARLDPTRGLRSALDGPSLALHLGATLLGVGVLALGAWVLWAALVGLLGRTDLSPAEVLRASGVVLGALAWRACVVLLLGGAVAFAFHRWRHRQRLRMSRRELRDEARQTHGDPEARRRRARRRRALAMAPSVSEAASRAALLVHGDGVTVAVEWDGGDGSPSVALVARGVAARQLRAQASHVAALTDPALAAALASLDDGAPVPRARWRALASALLRAAA